MQLLQAEAGAPDLIPLLYTLLSAQYTPLNYGSNQLASLERNTKNINIYIVLNTFIYF